MNDFPQRHPAFGQLVRSRLWRRAFHVLPNQGTEIRINPAWDLKHNRKYQVEIRAGLVDRAGNPLAPSTWRFKTIPW